jgi:hypothetical protein
MPSQDAIQTPEESARTLDAIHEQLAWLRRYHGMLISTSWMGQFSSQCAYFMCICLQRPMRLPHSPRTSLLAQMPMQVWQHEAAT